MAKGRACAKLQATYLLRMLLEQSISQGKSDIESYTAWNETSISDGNIAIASPIYRA